MTSPLGGTKRKSEYSDDKVIGLAEYEVTGFNPEVNKDDQPINYMGEKDGNATMRIAVMLKDVKTGRPQILNFFLENKEIVSKDGAKKQYINDIGRTSYSDSPENLSEKFAASPYHVARAGEADLVAFLDAFLDIDRSAAYHLTVNWDALMKGDIRELTGLLKGDLPRTICVVATVRTVDKQNEDGTTETKEYQQMYSRRIIPGYNMRHFRNKAYTMADIEKLREKDVVAKETKKNYLKQHEKFLVDITDTEFGIKDAYFWGLAKPYNPEENVAAGNLAHVSDEDTSY